MQPAIVLGSTRATVKHDSLDGQRLVIVQPTGVDDAADGPPLIAIDAQGCRKGDRVMLTSDGTYARDVTGHSETPARWSVMGIMDDTKSK
ncbi:EutN/CcmL family microcompartment protein [Planctomycetes bacterium K23_9]|uniref:Ethanolamine utilization protein EutN n=1 Tax=Stieleria marina TaxID=1930275 RepID=A0A517P1B3_9BACT|nr:Ethanolamine utilization protein EutN [Planctomycetes bacterium K23_9]